MRRSTPISGPAFLIAVYYFVVLGTFITLPSVFPQVNNLMPFGGIDALMANRSDTFEAIGTPIVYQEQFDEFKLVIAIIGTVLLMVPISWVYFITNRARKADVSFVQTIMVLPIVVAGIAVIVHNSIPLAFSLAGIVAAVRFRFSLDEPAHALYIFIAIIVGLGAGISSLEISMVTSVLFVVINLILWKLQYGTNLSSRFFAFLTGRGRDDDALE
ncbi:MAG: hypothetical protein O3A63_20365 [Proteobacteria bacterium]|nr:hypothetical protein [Pseudomonadota bacterium]